MKRSLLFAALLTLAGCYNTTDPTLNVEVCDASHQETYVYTTFMPVGKVMVPQTHTGTRTVCDRSHVETVPNPHYKPRS